MDFLNVVVIQYIQVAMLTAEWRGVTRVRLNLRRLMRTLRGGTVNGEAQHIEHRHLEIIGPSPTVLEKEIWKCVKTKCLLPMEKKLMEILIFFNLLSISILLSVNCANSLFVSINITLGIDIRGEQCEKFHTANI